MNLYDRSVDLSVRLDAASAAESSEDLLVRGRTLSLALDDASAMLEGADRFRVALGVREPSNIDAKPATQAVRSFRAGLSKHGAAGFQHQPATNLQAAARDLSTKVSRWASSLWKHQFESVQPLLEREERGNFVGDDSHKRVARSRAQSLRAAQRIDPLREEDKLAEVLGGPTLVEWLAGISQKAAELSSALDVLDGERNALTPQVREVLVQAASPDGFPLDSVGPELLAELRAAGVLADLVVRRP
jgi:hypothetical protein